MYREKMRLAASYNYFNGDEHFIASLKAIRETVDVISVVWQETSNSGELISEEAKDALDDALAASLVDQIIEYQPDLSITRKENEKQKRRIGLDLARKAGATHFLSLDADEFYRRAEFDEAKRLITHHGWKSTSVSSFMHIKRPIYRTLDSTNCCFITEICEETKIGVLDFPCQMVDSSRRMTASAETHYHFPAKVVAMYHMNTIRRDISQKLRNSSTTNQDFLTEVQSALDQWTPGEVFVFPKKGTMKVEKVLNEFDTFDPEETPSKQNNQADANQGHRWLLATHHLLDYSGSEVVTLELAEELLRRGIHVSLFAQASDTQFLQSAVPDGAQLFSAASEIDLRGFDVVYCQHQTVSQILSHQDIDYITSPSRPIFIYNHLSPYEPFEAPGPFVEETFADIILCNSLETQESLARFGSLFAAACVFQNPSPRMFSISERRPAPQVSSILSVSNHVPAELLEALNILGSQEVRVTQIGRKAGQRRLGIDDLTDHDAVVTIGKTVQQAFRAKLPVFCYDQFGGPGWLTEENIDLAEKANFSGRCSPSKRSAQDLSNEIREGFSSAFIYSEVPERFCLELMMDRLFKRLHSLRNSRKSINIDKLLLKANLERERSVYALVDREYKKGRNNNAWKAQVENLTRIKDELLAGNIKTKEELFDVKEELLNVKDELSKVKKDGKARRSKIANHLDFLDYKVCDLLSRMPLLSKSRREKLAEAAQKRYRSRYR